MYTSHDRVERDGFLVAYAGEVMSDEEAARRGLLVVRESHADGSDAGAADGNPAVPTVRELKAILDARGVPYDKKAKKDDLIALVAETEPTDDAGDGGPVDEEDDLYDDGDEGEDA